MNPVITLDTNAYTHMMAGDKIAIERIENASTIFIPIIVLAELFYGFKLGSQTERNMRILERFLKKKEVSVSQTTIQTAQLFAEIKKNLKLKGNPIPINDIWIAALSIEKGSTLFTYDSHFDVIQGLSLVRG